MRTNSPRITLLAPGCFSALAQPEDGVSEPTQASSPAEINQSTAIKTPTAAFEQALAAALQQPIPALGELPIAQHRFLMDTGNEPPAHCVCAELIHLQADKDNARLLPMQALSISEHESEQLVAALNSLLKDDGLELLRANSNHYYLTGMPATQLDTWPAHTVANGKIADYLPRHAEAGDWRRLMTEVQMLFHAHSVNIERINQQKLPVNAMWFWGGSKLEHYAPVQNLTLIASDAYACGLAAAMQVNTINAEQINWSESSEDIVVVELAVYEAWLSGDQTALLKAKQALHEKWIIPAQQAVANGVFGEFVLDGCEGQAIVEKPKQQFGKFSLKRFSLRKLFSLNNAESTRSGRSAKHNDDKS